MQNMFLDVFIYVFIYYGVKYDLFCDIHPNWPDLYSSLNMTLIIYIFLSFFHFFLQLFSTTTIVFLFVHFVCLYQQNKVSISFWLHILNFRDLSTCSACCFR